MRRSYQRAEVLKQLDARGGTFTTQLEKHCYGWNPANLRNPIQGPVDEITWTRLSDGRVSMDVTRGHHGRIEYGVQHQHSVSEAAPPDRATVVATQRRGKRILAVGLALYLTSFVIGAVVGSVLAGRASSLAILLGGLIGYVGCATVLRTIVAVIAIRRRNSAGATRSRAA